MPCDSVITNTQMTDAGRVREALQGLGLVLHEESTDLCIQTAGLTLYRGTTRDAFKASGDVSRLAEVGKKYAELSMRAWAKRNGMLVRSADENGGTLVSVRR